MTSPPDPGHCQELAHQAISTEIGVSEGLVDGCSMFHWILLSCCRLVVLKIEIILRLVNSDLESLGLVESPISLDG